ncbi:MAG: hypothetical protein DU429_05170 [Candidatus Tokpelaia sp.]|uniref:hypothetical protein n=1 Tax=Candidatus Tokpelaia sp. TaxID=2233777 RepID=UPI00123C6412|nr:hypothetical protein [Candidatus Tokpelaia sp.]KAA6204560.1 MAG: hypothetical protein DU430_07880 [Candidatus Tokpelaia sp.]KAA6206853.1 MAG: hypothetical protein DU429_05170 [Candidatus Tokpelaia sp.]KAA6404613.1 hypothetical protein DPQ22_09030 [Candidatus Tokpelaia sp.]
MSYILHRVRDWPLARLAPYNSALTAAVNSLAARFPDDVSPAILAKNVACGLADLWLIVDENEAFIAFLITEMEITVGGKKRLLLLELAGEGALALTALLPQLEDFARRAGAAAICPCGRLGWNRALARCGYKIATVKYIKEL